MTGLVKKIEQKLEAVTAKTPRALGVYVLFDSNVAGLDKRIRETAEKEGLKRVSLCIGAPPENYEVSKDAEVTVVVYSVARRNQQKVMANFALRKGELNEAKIDAIVKAVGEVLPK